MFDRILSVNYNSSKDCFIYLPSKYLKTGSCVQLTYGDNKIAYFSVSASTVKVVNECISLSSVCAKILEIEENELVRVSQILNLPTVNRITIAPVNSNEYEILELLAENVQSTLLDQIRVVNTGQKFVIWAGSNISIAVCVENVEPQSPGIIDFLTEVVIEPKTFSELALYQPSVLLLDDLHLLCESIKGDDVAPNAIYSNRVSEMIHTCLKMFPRCNKIGICVTVESTAKLNKNLYSSRGSHLFKNLHSISDLTKADRIDFLKHFFEKYKLLDVNFDYISIKTEGFVIQDIIDFCNKSIFEAYKDDCDEENLVLNNNHFERALKNACVLSLQTVHLHSPGSKSFTDIGGLHDVKKILVESLMWPAQYPGIFAKAPLRLQSGLLLYGPPGTGKTLLAGAAAKHCGLRLISIKGPELLSKYIGASEQAVRDVFQKAQSARPCILFFDEFDSLAPRRGHDNTGVTDRVVNQLLTQLDGIESLSGVCVLAATSRPDLLDPALLRPGRLDRQILCPLPSKDDRLEILTILSKNLDLSEDVNLEAVASATKGYSGADLQSILYTAQLSTIDHLLDSSKESLAITKSQVTQKHLKEAISKTRPSLPEQERLKYERIYSKFERGNTIDEFRAGSKATLA